MGIKHWLAVSILAASFAAGASAPEIDWKIFAEPFVTSAHAQDVDWQKVDDTFGRKPTVSGTTLGVDHRCDAVAHHR